MANEKHIRSFLDIFLSLRSIMLIGAVASFILAGIMALLVGLGFWHATRTTSEE